MSMLEKANKEFQLGNYMIAKGKYEQGQKESDEKLRSIYNFNINLCLLRIGEISIQDIDMLNNINVYESYYKKLKDKSPKIIDTERKIKNSQLAKNYILNSELVSIVMPTWNRGEIISESIQSVLNQSYQNWELLICDDGSTDNTSFVVQGFKDKRIKYFKLEKNNGAVARNHAIRKSEGNIIAFLDSDNLWHPKYLECITNAHFLNKSPIVYTGFYDIEINEGNVKIFEEKYKSFDFHKLSWRNYIDLNTLSMRKEVLQEVGMFDPLLERQQDWDLIIRCASAYNFYGIDLPLVLYQRNTEWNQITTNKRNIDTRSIILSKNKIIKETYSQEKSKNKAEEFFDLMRKRKKPIGNECAIKNKVAIKISAPSQSSAHTWGDLHFAHQLGKALYKFGWEYEVHCQDEWYTKEEEIEFNLILRGRHKFIIEKSKVKKNIMWLISHPDRVNEDEYNDYNHIFIASAIYAKKVEKITTRPVSVLYQAADIEVFKPHKDKLPLPSKVIFIGNSRKEFRTLVKWSIASGIDISVWGQDWEDYIDPYMIKGKYIPNSEVPLYYSSCEILLNDHWNSMAKNGFISNRVFDASAAGAFVISDNVEGIKEVFGDSIEIAKSKESLEYLVKKYLKSALLRNEKSEEARKIVINNHTFLHRAEEINNILIKNIK